MRRLSHLPALSYLRIGVFFLCTKDNFLAAMEKGDLAEAKIVCGPAPVFYWVLRTQSKTRPLPKHGRTFVKREGFRLLSPVSLVSEKGRSIRIRLSATSKEGTSPSVSSLRLRLTDASDSYTAQFEHTLILLLTQKEVLSRGDDY